MSKLAQNMPSNGGQGKSLAAALPPSSTTNYTGRANYIIYLLCITSFGFSVYTSLCHSELQDRIRHIHHLDERVSVLEAKLRIFPIQFLQSLATKLPSSASSPGAEAPFAPSIDNSSAADALDAGDAEEVAHVMRQLSLQVSSIQRLRRDVSYLKASRRGERQASAQPATDACMCPPGKRLHFAVSHRTKPKRPTRPTKCEII